MAATTDLYLQLQRIYRDQADADVTAIEAHLQKLLTAHGRAAASIPRVFIKQFCKNARNLRWGSASLIPAPTIASCRDHCMKHDCI